MGAKVCTKKGYLTSFICGGGGKNVKAWMSLTWWINLVMQFPPGPEAAVTVLPVDVVRGVLGRLRATLCLYRGTQPLGPGPLVVGCTDVSPLILPQGCILSLYPSFPDPDV